MKGHIVMYLIMGAVGVAILSRPAAAAGEMVAGGSIANQTLGILSGQYAGGGGQRGTVQIPSGAGGNPLSASFG